MDSDQLTSPPLGQPFTFAWSVCENHGMFGFGKYRAEQYEYKRMPARILVVPGGESDRPLSLGECTQLITAGGIAYYEIKHRFPDASVAYVKQTSARICKVKATLCHACARNSQYQTEPVGTVALCITVAGPASPFEMQINRNRVEWVCRIT